MLSEQLFISLLDYYNNQVNNRNNIRFKRHIFIGEIQDIDFNKYSGVWHEKKEIILDSSELKSYFGEWYPYFWDLPVGEEDNSLLEIYFHNTNLYSNVPIELVLQQINQTIRGIDLFSTSVYCWGHQNPSNNFFCNIRNSYIDLINKKTRLVTYNNLLDKGLIKSILDKIINREITAPDFLDNSEINQIIYNSDYSLSISTTHNNNKWYQPNPLIISKDIVSVTTRLNIKNIDEFGLLKNQFSFITNNTFQKLEKHEFISIYFPKTVSNLHMYPHYNLDGSITNNPWLLEDSFSKKILHVNLLKDKDKSIGFKLL